MGGIYMIIFLGKRNRRSKAFLSYVISLSLIFVFIKPQEVLAVEFDVGKLYAMSAAVVDGYNGRTLIEKEADNPMANASTTKIMTCILTLENCSTDEKVLISRNAACQPKVKMGLTEGGEYKLMDLLYGLMLESYNDCAVAIAEHVAGDVACFSVMMNDKAREIGCKDTCFLTPNGLDLEKEGICHHTTARDLCLIMNYCAWLSEKSEEFIEITTTRSYGDFVNHNQLLGTAGVITGKTGYTAKAGYCYVCAVDLDGKKFSIALLGCGWPNNKNYKWIDAKNIIDYISSNYQTKDLFEKLEKQSVTVLGAFEERKGINLWKKKIKCYAVPKECNQFFLVSENDELQIDYLIDGDGVIEAKNVGGNSFVGKYRATIKDTVIGENYLYLDRKISSWNYRKFFRKVFEKFFSKY